MNTSAVLSLITLLTSFACLANGEVSILKGNLDVTNITVRSRLSISTRDYTPTSLQLKAINDSLNNFLNQTHVYIDESGEKFQLNFDVVAVNFKDLLTPRPSDNYIEINAQGQDFASPLGIKLTNYQPTRDLADIIITVGDKATISSRAIDPYSSTLSHEILHLFGLDDRYHNYLLSDG